MWICVVSSVELNGTNLKIVGIKFVVRNVSNITMAVTLLLIVKPEYKVVARGLTSILLLQIENVEIFTFVDMGSPIS